MPVLPTIRSTFRTLFKGRHLDRELDQELQDYVDLLVDEKVSEGLDPKEARRQALIELEGAEQVKATVRETRHGAGLDMLLHDIRFALRMLKRSPGFAAIFVLTLAIGIGANTALFSTIKALLVSDLPYHESHRLVVSTKTYEGRSRGPVSRLDYLDYRKLNRSLEGFAAISGSGRTVLTGLERAESVRLVYATWNLFSVLGVAPAYGRPFLESEEQIANANLAIIGHDLWQRRFDGALELSDIPLELDGESFQVVGVMPEGFKFLFEAEVWILVDRECPVDAARDSHSMWAVGRLEDGVSLDQAQDDVSRVAAALEKEYPDTNKAKGLMLWDLRDYMVAHVRASLNMLMATTGLLLLIACTNVAGLQLARGQRRVSEMAMRSALGASRQRLIRQLLTESVILTLVAGIAGIAVAYLFHELLLRLLPPGDPGVPLPTIDGGVLLFAVVISVLVGLLVGIVPAIRGTSFTIWDKLETSKRASEGRGGARLRSVMVVVQVALSVILLIGCGLLVRSMINLSSVDLGFDTENVIGATYSIQASDDSSIQERVDPFTTLLEDLEALPGVSRAAAITKLPIASRSTDWPIWRASDPRPEPRDSRLALARAVTPGYFETIGIPLLRGRDFSGAEIEGTAPVVILSEAIARYLFPDSESIGQMVKLGWFDYEFEVVGVVGNARINGVRREYDEALYMASSQFGPPYQWLVVRTDGDPAVAMEPIRKLVESRDPNAVLGDLVVMADLVDEDLSGFRVVMFALGVLSVVALLLTAVGLYGVLAYQVSQRTNEYGIRAALGASPNEVIGLVLRKGLFMVGLGISVGLIGAYLSSRLFQRLLYEIEPLDPMSYVGAAVFFAAVALIACLVPAWRAARIDPMEALRAE